VVKDQGVGLMYRRSWIQDWIICSERMFLLFFIFLFFFNFFIFYFFCKETMYTVLYILVRKGLEQQHMVKVRLDIAKAGKIKLPLCLSTPQTLALK
jgi:hypothetical protein